MSKKMSYWIVFATLLFAIITGVARERKEIVKPKSQYMKEIYFAGGCFWGTEHLMKQIRGVMKTEVGYANGKTKNPTYEEVCKNNTGFVETVKVEYDATEVGLSLLLEFFFKSIDPTTLNKQGHDIGTQYRSGIYYTDVNDKAVINAALTELQTQYSQPIVVELMPIESFYSAEEYHQDYLDKNVNGYCHVDKRLFEEARKANQPKHFSKPDAATLKSILSPEQYAVTQKSATEAPFHNEYWNEQREGIYVDVTTGEPLFISTDKFNSECGWPSFSKPISDSLISEKLDLSHGMTRTEVRSKMGDSHLGHLFNDGPKEKGGMRYCINSASLRFIPKSEMVKAGYGNYLNLLEKK